jgi:hypothetical protein
MSRRRKAEVVEDHIVVQDEVHEIEEVQRPKLHVTLHLDRDPNDPRNQPETKSLPSLDD